MSHPAQLEQAVEQADLFIGAVPDPGAKAPKLVSEAMVCRMQPGSVMFDIAVDPGGSIEMIDRWNHCLAQVGASVIQHE